MIDLDEKAALGQMLLLGEVGHGQHRGETYPGGLAPIPEILHGMLFGPLFEVNVEEVLVLESQFESVEQAERGPFGFAHQLDEPLPLILFDRNQEDQAIGTGEDLPRIDQTRA